MVHKGEHGQVHEAYIVHTVVCQKAPVRLKQHQTVNSKACSLIRYRVTLV